MDETTLNSVINAMMEMDRGWAIVVRYTDENNVGIEVRRVHLESEDSVQRLTTHEKSIVRRENVSYLMTMLLIQEGAVGQILKKHVLPIFELDPRGSLRLVDRNLNPV